MYSIFTAEPAKKKIEDLLSQSYLRRSDLTCKIYESAIIYPAETNYDWKKGIIAGVIKKDGVFLKETNFNEEQNGTPSFNVHSDTIQEEKKSAIFLGVFHPIYGHCITDNVKRVWFLYTKEGRDLVSQDVDLVYVTAFPQPLPDYAIKILSLAGVNVKNLRCVTQATRYKTVYVPDSSFIIEDSGKMYNEQRRVYTKEFVSVIDKIKENVVNKPELPRKIYFSRSYLKNNLKRECGEREIEAVFRKMGYNIIAPERLTIIQQLELLNNCTHFAATEGSVAHNAVFCSPGTNVVILRKADYYNTYQFALDEISKVNPIYIDVYYTRPPYQDGVIWIGPFYMGVTKYLQKFANIHFFSVPRWLKLNWWMYYLTRHSWFMKLVGNRKIYHKLENLIQLKYNDTCEKYINESLYERI